MKNIYEVQSANKLKSAIIVALFVVFVFLAVYILTNAYGYYMGYQPGGLGFFGIALIVSGVSSFVGYYYSDNKDLSSARMYFKKSADLDNKFAPAYNMIGYCQ